MNFRISFMDQEGENSDVEISIWTMQEFQVAINTLAQLHFLITNIERLKNNA